MGDFIDISQGFSPVAVIEVRGSTTFPGQVFTSGQGTHIGVSPNFFSTNASQVIPYTGTTYLKRLRFFFGSEDNVTVNIRFYKLETITDINVGDDINDPTKFTLKPVTATFNYTIPATGSNNVYALQDIDMSSLNMFLISGEQYLITLQNNGANTNVGFARTSFPESAYPDHKLVNIDYSTGIVYSDEMEDMIFEIVISETAGGGGDPWINCLDSSHYKLPVNDNIYCLIDTLDKEDRLVINAKCHIRKNNCSYFRYIYVYYNGDEMIVRLPTLHMIKVNQNNFDELVKKQNLAPNRRRRYKGNFIEEVKSNSKERKWIIKTKKYGDLGLLCAKSKFKCHLLGSMSQFINTRTIGCVTGKVFRINSLKFKAQL